MVGSLYIVGTPIGNLNDMTFRAIETLKSVDFIAAEDTRVTVKLLNYFEIKKPMISYYEHNIRERGKIITDRILQGENCAIVSDAGMPCISDPGEDLVRLCIENNINIQIVPGATALISALCLSGLNTSRFSFEGFLSKTPIKRYEHLQSLKQQTNTLIFYEAPHKLLKTLNDLYKHLGDRKISLARELTKIYEDVNRTTISEAIEYYNKNNPKGEFVLIVEGFKDTLPEKVTIEQAVQMAQNLINNGEKLTEASRIIAKQTGIKKSDIYKKLI